MKKDLISMQSANFADWKEWISRYGAELIIFSAIFGIAIFAGSPGEIPGDRFMKCYFKELTGLSCPSCGLTRGFIAFFHADFAEAFRQNALTYLLIPLFAYRIARSLSASVFKRHIQISLPPMMVFGIVILGLIYAAGRLAIEIGVKYHLL